MKLAAKQKCPIHHSYFCCGRETSVRKPESKKGWTKIGSGLWKIEDEHHPRGYRIRRSASAMRALVTKKVEQQDGLCSICNLPMTDMREIGPDHKDPRGNGGAFRDDHEDNIGAAHNVCNVRKGSRRIA